MIKYLIIGLLLTGCSDPIVKTLKTKYPQCDILKVEEIKGYQKAILQCPGNNIKEVKLKKRK